MRNPIFIKALVCEGRTGGVSRVSADVGGEMLWFESPNAELRLSPEGFGSVLLVPAMSHGRDLVFDDPLCPVWLANMQKLMGLFSEWWGWKPIKIESKFSGTRAPINDQPRKRYLCFSGGIDSFYSLLTYPEPIDALMMVHGYDIRLDDESGARIAFGHVRAVADEMNIGAVMVRTNYREHSVAGKKYPYAYGGALAGIGHLLDQVGELIISSGTRYDEVDIDGSHWQTDPLWSSTCMKVIHYGEHAAKDDKARNIAANPWVKKHLRVCQQNWFYRFEISERFLNCGRCHKCVHTLIVLQQEGSIDDLENFQNKTKFDTYLNKEQQCKDYLFRPYEEICQRGVDKKTEHAIRALIRRSKVLNRMGWAGRRGRKAAFQLFRLVDAVERKLCCS